MRHGFTTWYELSIDFRQWLLGINFYDGGWNVFIGPIRVNAWH